MTRNELLNFSFEENNEKNLKKDLIEKSIEYSFDKISSILTHKNKLILSSYNIDENTFNQMLFTNYIYFMNSSKKLNAEKLSDDDREIIELFNHYIETDCFEEAFKIYTNNFIIYDLLCMLYIKNLNETSQDKINQLDDKKIDKVYKKLSLLKNTNLTLERKHVKVLQKVSNK